MRQPKLSDVKIDSKGTKDLRAKFTKNKKIKITINVDEESLALLRKMSDKTGTPYQRLLNQILKAGLNTRTHDDSRLERIEKEIELLKRQIAA